MVAVFTRIWWWLDGGVLGCGQWRVGTGLGFWCRFLGWSWLATMAMDFLGLAGRVGPIANQSLRGGTDGAGATQAMGTTDY